MTNRRKMGVLIENDSTKLRFISVEPMLESMNELDRFWSEKLSNAIEQVRGAGRGDLADYLELKAANDAVRQAETEKLFKLLTDRALSAENIEKNIHVERESPHSFVHRNATMTGFLLRLSRGVRCLTVEAGWTRRPGDGFMRFGALVFSRITHFGLPEKNVELILKPNDGSILWHVVRSGAPAESIGPEAIEGQIEILIDDRVR